LKNDATFTLVGLAVEEKNGIPLSGSGMDIVLKLFMAGNISKRCP